MVTKSIDQDFYAVNADVQLAGASKKEKENFAGIQNTLKSSKSISLFDANHDGKLGDNEYLLVQAQNGEYSVIYSPKNGTSKRDILKQLSSEYSLKPESVPDNIDYAGFLQIPVKNPQISKAEKDNTELSQINKELSKTLVKDITKILNGDGRYNFGVKIGSQNGKNGLLISISTDNTSWFRRAFFGDKPSFLYIKEKLGLKDEVIAKNNSIYDLAGRKKPWSCTGYGINRNNYDTFTLEPGQIMFIPLSEINAK